MKYICLEPKKFQMFEEKPTFFLGLRIKHCWWFLTHAHVTPWRNFQNNSPWFSYKKQESWPYFSRETEGYCEPQLMHWFTEITTSAIPLPSIKKGKQPLDKKDLRELSFIYYISPKLKQVTPKAELNLLIQAQIKK